MAAGAAPAPAKTTETSNEAQEAQSQPPTLKQRIVRKLHEIFQGRDEYLGWRQ
ncbi:MAG TPA: hypothetical protein VMF10_09725 [Candidatus Aquilonibacter sp.]|nr:hypothetical protein [Candidatus Aquilonibacter sp.]